MGIESGSHSENAAPAQSPIKGGFDVVEQQIGKIREVFLQGKAARKPIDVTRYNEVMGFLHGSLARTALRTFSRERLEDACQSIGVSAACIDKLRIFTLYTLFVAFHPTDLADDKRAEYETLKQDPELQYMLQTLLVEGVYKNARELTLQAFRLFLEHICSIFQNEEYSADKAAFMKENLKMAEMFVESYIKPMMQQEEDELLHTIEKGIRAIAA